MAATAEKVTPIEEGKDLVQFGKALVKFDIQEQVIQDLEEATKLEITDTDSEKVVRKHRQNAKTIEVRIEKTRLQLNREFKEKTDAAAALIAPRVTAAYKKLDEKVKVVEAEREARKAEKEEAERLRLGKIQWRMDGLEVDCQAGLIYNTSAAEIQEALNTLRKVEISAVDFEEQTEKADQMLGQAIFDTEIALEERENFEAGQAKLAEEKAKQEAEAKRLAEERAKMEAEQKAREEEARKAAEAEVEKRRQEEEKLRVEREALELEKAILAEKQYQRDWDEAFEINLGMIHEQAIEEHAEYQLMIASEIDQLRMEAKRRWEATEKAREEAAARKPLVALDKDELKSIYQAIAGTTYAIQNIEYKTVEGKSIHEAFIGKIGDALEWLEQAGAALK